MRKELANKLVVETKFDSVSKNCRVNTESSKRDVLSELEIFALF
jgi:hypothetical protein